MENINEKKKNRVAIVHDFLTYFGGAEQVVKSLHHMYPDAPIFTLLYDRKMQQYFPDAKIIPSFLDKFPNFLKKRKKLLLPFFPTAIETFDLGSFDVVISSSSSFAKGLIVRPKTLHINYCHTPTRFLWDWHTDYLAENKIGNIRKIFVLPIIHFARIWDRLAADRVDFYIANSKNTQRRIKKFYKKESSVIYPPVDFKTFSSFKGDKGVDIKDYYLIVSRLSPYKKIDIAIQAFNKMNLPLVIVGDGEDRKRLEKMAERNIHFVGFQNEDNLMSFYQNCKAFIFPAEEDFGISAVEAMSFGKPVLAFKKGGALETVVEGVTGEFFESPVAEILADGIRRLEKNRGKYDAEEIKKHAQKFSRENFERNMKDFIDKALDENCHTGLDIA
jgi:glycosyltransferase involved in cell wall biosynthesis